VKTANPDVPNLIWSTHLAQPPAGPPLVAGDLLLVPTQEPAMPPRHGALQALNLSDGSPRWRKPFEYALVSGLAQTGKGSILVAIASTDLLRGQGALLALDAAGEERWRWAPGVQRISAPVAAEDLACVTVDTKSLVLLDLDTGAERTAVDLPAPASLAALVLGDGVAYVPCRGPHLLAVGLDGETRWHFSTDDGSNAWLDKAPLPVGERLFAVLSSGAVLALNRRDGSLAWRVDVGPAGKSLSPPAADGERLYVGARDGLHTLRLTDGAEVWAFPTGRRIEAAPLVVEGVVYAAGRDHHLYALDAATGQELWRVALTRRIEHGPAVGGERVLVADRGGHLLAVERVLSAEVYAGRGRWEEAAAAHLRRGELAPAACIYQERLAQPLRAAELWEEVGEAARAAPLYEQAGRYEQAASLFESEGAWADARRCYEHLNRRPKVAALSERLEDWARAGSEWEALGELERAACAYRQAANWSSAARLYEQVEAWPQAADCYERAGRWESVGRIRRRMGDFDAAAKAFIRAAGQAEQTSPHNEARLADLWAEAESCCREAFDEEQAEVCRRRVARYRGQPYLEVEIVPPETMIKGKYAYLEFILRNVGGGQARQIVVHHTPSEFVGQLSHTQEIRGLNPGQEMQQRLSVRPLAAGPVPLVIAADYRDVEGNSYQIAYRTHVAVAERDAPAVRPSAPPPALTATYADVEILIGQRREGSYPVHVIRSPSGEARGSFRLPFVPEELAEALRWLEAGDTNEDFLQDAGVRLFEALFEADVGRRFHSSRGMTAQGKGLRIRLRLEPPELQALPWELLRDPEKREFLVLSKRSLVTRYLHVPRPTPPLEVEPPLRVLVAVAAPRNVMPLDADREVRHIRQALQPLVDEGMVNLTVEPHITKPSLRQCLLDDDPHVLHYIGHGDLADDRGLLLLEDDTGRADRLDGPTLGILLKESSVRLAVLNACLTAREVPPGGSDFAGRRAAFMGVGPALVHAGLGAVVAMQFSMFDASARAFARDFYEMLARFKPVDECVSRAREALLLEVGLGHRDWATPVLFMRAPDGQLFAPPQR